METVRGKWESFSVSTNFALRYMSEIHFGKVLARYKFKAFFVSGFGNSLRHADVFYPNFQKSAVEQWQTGGNSEN